jgi:hypothetical protein
MFRDLLSLGIEAKKICFSPHLLGWNPKTIRQNFNNLLDLGIIEKTIVKSPYLLSMNPETVQINYHNPLLLGFTPQKDRYCPCFDRFQ